MHPQLSSWAVGLSFCTGFRMSVIKNYFSIKTYTMGTQKNHLNETVLLCISNTCLNQKVRK